jgi:hypothetical protein
MRNYLIVANQTLGGDALAAKLTGLAEQGPCSFRFVVPATPRRHGITWTEGEARARAAWRLTRALSRFEALGVEVTGHVADANPLLAIADMLRRRPADEVILCTLPAGLSRWLRQDLPSRVSRSVPVPVTHLVVGPEHELEAVQELIAA